MLPLPGVGFDPCDWRSVKADKTGSVVIDANRYLAGPRWRSMRLQAGVRVFEIELRDPDGGHIVTLERVWGKSAETQADPTSLLAIIARKPRIWGESPIRNDFPDTVRSLLDRMDGRVRADLLDDIRAVAADCGFAATVKAVETVIDAGRTIDRAAIATCARRVLEGKGSSGGQDLKHHDKYMEDGHEHTRRPAAQARRQSGRQGHTRTGHGLGVQPAVDAQRAREGHRERDPGPARLPRQPVRGRERQPGQIQTVAAARTGRLPLEQDPGRLRPGAWPRSPPTGAASSWKAWSSSNGPRTSCFTATWAAARPT